MVLQMILTVVIAFVIGLLVGKWMIPVLRALKAGQSIREIGPSWHNSKAGTPTMGGIAFIAACIACILVGIPSLKNGEYGHIFVFLMALAFGAIGFYDDYIKVKKKRNLGLTALQKLVLQLAVSAAYLLVLRHFDMLTNDIYVPFFNVSFTLNWVIYIIFAVFVIVGCVNAVNLTDGIDGLASGVTIPVMIYFAVMAVTYKTGALALFPAALAGGLAAFLVYNFHPAKVFMGDTGSLFLGGAVCGMAFALDMPLVLIPIGLIYIMETLSVILQVGYFKLTHGKRIFKMTPIHHHFEMCGWSEKKIFAVFTSVTAALCILTWLGTAGRF
ncbi:MAG: phospho-N-acetylmuramoyl-pentapeptide-transferase [Oscillospiraceae bacterium]|nr:phospho-N-acetylmuramoyl-pentapeptide-transferase [Oscillospiraceae bacterium]